MSKTSMKLLKGSLFFVALKKKTFLLQNNLEGKIFHSKLRNKHFSKKHFKRLGDLIKTNCLWQRKFS